MNQPTAEKRAAEIPPADVAELVNAAQGLLRKVDHITTADYAHGGERPEREALRVILARVLGVPLDDVTYPPLEEAEQARGRLVMAAPDMTRALAEIAVMCGFCFNVTARDVRAAELASKALDLAGITDPAAWLKTHAGG
jgi:hypothetical protein